jgi:hypothetical protein
VIPTWQSFLWFPVFLGGILAMEFLAEAAAVMYPKWKEKRKNALRTKLPH